MNDDIVFAVYEHALAHGWRWRINGDLMPPTLDDVRKLLENNSSQVRKSPTSISVEVGGVLIKRTDDYIDVYVHAGGFK